MLTLTLLWLSPFLPKECEKCETKIKFGWTCGFDDEEETNHLKCTILFVNKFEIANVTKNEY